MNQTIVDNVLELLYKAKESLDSIDEWTLEGYPAGYYDEARSLLAQTVTTIEEELDGKV